MSKSKSVIKSNINNQIYNNVTQEVSPEDIRSNLIDMIESAHLLTEGESILAGNFSTPSTRNTKVGEETMSNLNLPGYVNSDNVGVGYYSLHPIYIGSYNSAIGSYSQSCNMFGDYVTSVGFSSCAGNKRGDGSVGIGAFTLYNNVDGDYNIAIGHGAGYYVGENDSYKFYLGAHPIDESGVCENFTGSGFVPLLFGDMLNKRLAINSNTLNNYATLEIHGSGSPRITEWYSNSGELVAYIDNDGNLYQEGIVSPTFLGWEDSGFDGLLDNGDDTLQKVFDKVDDIFPRLDYSDVAWSGNLASGDNTLQLIFDKIDSRHRPVELQFMLSDAQTPISTTGDVLTFKMPFDMLLTSARTNEKSGGADAELDIERGGISILSGILTSSQSYDFYSGVGPVSYGVDLLDGDIINIVLNASGTNTIGLTMAFKGATSYSNSPYYGSPVATWDDIY